jgi:hypothetical protein
MSVEKEKKTVRIKKKKAKTSPQLHECKNIFPPVNISSLVSRRVYSSLFCLLDFSLEHGISLSLSLSFSLIQTNWTINDCLQSDSRKSSGTFPPISDPQTSDCCYPLVFM